MDHDHEQAAEALCATVREAKSPLSLQRQPSKSNLTRATPFKARCSLVDASSFHHVLKVEEDLIIVEPLVTMEQMARAAITNGRVPLVVPEFRGITVGGAVMGAALESSSHRHGQFNDTVAWCEMVLGNGDRIRLSPSEHADLFYALAGSYGTLGILTRLAIRLQPAHRYVHVRCSRSDNIAPLLNPEVEFADGLVWGPDDYLVMLGEPTDAMAAPLYRPRPWSPWWFQRARDARDEVMGLEDYLFRYDRGAFWMGRYLLHPALMWAFLTNRSLPPDRLAERLRALRYSEPGPLFRGLFGWAMGCQHLYRTLHAMPDDLVGQRLLIQDSIMPLETVERFIEYACEKHKTYPLWLCPLRRTEAPQFLSPHSIESAYRLALNVGTYGVSDMGEGRAATLDLEERVRELGGRKALYSHSYYPPEVFWTLYDRGKYEEIRARYHAAGRFPSVEEKVLTC